MQQHRCRRMEGKVAVVTAATAGIGKAIAIRLGQEGAKVFICSRKQANVDETLAELHAMGLEVSGCSCHVGQAEQRQALIKAAVEKYGSIDILVSNAAVNPVAGPILDTPSSAFDTLFNINIKAAALLVSEAVPFMKRGGSIVMISSITAFNPPEPIGAYAVSKTALLGLIRGLAAELAPKGLRVNGVAPGIVPTKFASALVEDPELEQQQKNNTMLKRLGRAEDMAAAVAYLASEDASYVTAETLVVAGGMPSRL